MFCQVLWQSMLAGLLTVLGALIVVAMGPTRERVLAFFWGLRAVVMTAVVVLDLLPSATWITAMC